MNVKLRLAVTFLLCFSPVFACGLQVAHIAREIKRAAKIVLILPLPSRKETAEGILTFGPYHSKFKVGISHNLPPPPGYQYDMDNTYDRSLGKHGKPDARQRQDAAFTKEIKEQLSIHAYQDYAELPQATLSTDDFFLKDAIRFQAEPGSRVRITARWKGSIPKRLSNGVTAHLIVLLSNEHEPDPLMYGCLYMAFALCFPCGWLYKRRVQAILDEAG